MEGLLKQMRVRSPNAGGEPNRGLQPQKTQSFKEKKKQQSWLRRQFSRQMSEDHDYNPSSSNGNVEHTVAIAAAALAIKSLEEGSLSIPDKNKNKKVVQNGDDDQDYPSKTPLRKSKTKMVDIVTTPNIIPEPTKISKQLSGLKDKEVIPKIPSTPEKTVGPTLFKKTASFTDKRSESTGYKRSGGKLPIPPPYPSLTPIKPEAIGPKRVGVEETKADTWEKAELAKIKQRLEELNRKIRSWEEEKKIKARNRLDKTEIELEKKREKAAKKFRSEMEYVKKIAGGGRAKADERQRNAVLKVKEKADVFRKTGNLPRTCFCF